MSRAFVPVGNMTRAKIVVGCIASALLFLSAGAHSILGGQAIRAELKSANVSNDLLNGIMMGWQFGGMAMLMLSAILGRLFIRRWKGAEVSAFPAMVVGVGYVAFGLWAMLGEGFQAFYLVFIVPGLMLVFATWPAGKKMGA